MKRAKDTLVSEYLERVGGAAARVRQGWQQGACVPLISTATAQEQEELLADYLPHAKAVRIPQPPPAVPKCRDAFDVPFLHLAVAGKARVLVSGDKDLLALAERFTCPIVTLEAFVRDYLSELG